MENINQTKEGFIKSVVVSAVILCICFMPFILFSQIPTRIIVNSGFELPALGCANSYAKQSHTNVPGWKTTDSSASSSILCGTAGASQSYLIELWTTTFNSRSAFAGNQFAETNANNAAFLYQEICLLANEAVPFSVWHLRRAASGTGEQIAAELKTSTGTNIATAATHTAIGSWTNYTGTLTNNGTTGLRRYGFRAVSGSNTGNLLDNVTISLKPLTDVKNFTAANTYETDSNYLNIYVNGTLSNAATVTFTKAGTATYLNDFTIGTPTRGNSSVNASGSITLTLPAGDYNPNLSTGSTAGLISIKIRTLNESVFEANETVRYTITATSGGGNGNAAMDLASNISGLSASCATAVGFAQFNILDIVSLPVKLLNFTAEREVGFNMVSWTVTSEDNVSKYILEYSTNGNDFITATEMQYDPSLNMNYVFDHQLGEFPNIIYRLKVVDREGNLTVLGEPVIVVKSINTSLAVFPNPNKGIFAVNYFSARDMNTRFTLTDVFGKEVYSTEIFSLKGDNSFVLGKDEEFVNGVYYLTYSYGEISRTVRVNILK
jgi:hypothetical protein